MQLERAKELAVEYRKELVYTGPGTLSLVDKTGDESPEEMWLDQIAEMQEADFIDFYLS